MDNSTAPVWIGGQWRESDATGTFQPDNPTRGETLSSRYPISSWNEVLEAILAGSAAADELAEMPGKRIADFLTAYAAGIEDRRAELVEIAHTETGLPVTPRLGVAELPRTVDQLRQAAYAGLHETWRRPVHDETRKIFSTFAPLGGPVVILGPNNFPFAFNSISGGDFAAAIAAHNPVIAKAHPAHPGTTRLLAEIASAALAESGLPRATVQLIYHLANEDGLKLVSHPRVGATAFTGSRKAGLALKAAADAAGKPSYLEMSSINPVVILPGALRERGTAIAEEFFTSCTMGAGQFCTNPGFVILQETPEANAFVETARQRFEQAAPGVLLGRKSGESIAAGIAMLHDNGAQLLCGGEPLPGPAFRFQNTLLTVSGAQFLAHPEALQTEVFGPVSLLVMSSGLEQALAILQQLEGNLTGTIYAAASGEDDSEFAAVARELRKKVGRLIRDRMPTGVAVSPAMNHGGPFPATAHPGFTAVGLPPSIQRFCALHCFENFPASQLPDIFRTE